MASLLLSGCHRRILQVHSEPLFPPYLASEQVDTPDPCRECFLGQQIVMRWSIPWHCYTDENFELRLTVRYGNRCIETFSYPLSSSYGYRIFRLINQEYWEKQGILTYKVELYRGETLFNAWKHHIWVEIIQINNS